MQFKEVGKVIQIHRYAGYDKVKKRAVVSMIGSLSRFSFNPSDGLMEKLTDKEKEELQSYIETERQSDSKNKRQSYINSAATLIKWTSDSLRSDDTTVTSQQADEIWENLAVLQKELKKRGFKKPDSQPDKVPDSRQKKLDV